MDIYLSQEDYVYYFVYFILDLFSDKKRRLYDNPIKPSNIKDGDIGKNPFSFQSK